MAFDPTEMLDVGFNVVIIGAGSTGLLLAQGLKKHNISCTVFEREDGDTYHKRPREWGMTLHWGAESIAACLPSEMAAGLNQGICCDPFYGEQDLTLPFFNAQTGEKLFDMPGSSPRRVSRRKLRHYLSQGIDVQYGKKLSSLVPNDATVTAVFADGSQITAPLVVGCDSAHSIVRRLLVGDQAGEEQYMDVSMLNVSCRFPRETALAQRTFGHPIFKNAFHPAGFAWWNSIQDVPDPNDPETWTFQNVLSWIGSPRREDFIDSNNGTNTVGKTNNNNGKENRDAILEFWREKATQFADPWRSIPSEIPPETHLTIDRVAVWSPEIDWSSSPFGSHVTIAGDAAHAMAPFRGQGLNHALEDAATLVHELVRFKRGEKMLDHAIRDYEREMRERSVVECRVSREQTLMIHSWDQLMRAPAFKHGMNKYSEQVQEM